jgi:hypothetical protein
MLEWYRSTGVRHVWARYCQEGSGEHVRREPQAFV